MPAATRTGRTAARTGRSTATRTGRGTTASQGRFARASSMSRTQGLRRRRQPEPSGVKKVLSAVLPTAAAKKAAPSSKKGKAGAGGIALVAAAAGMALKNRDKLSQMRNKGTNTSTGVTPLDTGANNAPMPPSTPAA